MKIALDSNVMIYAEGLADDPRNTIAQKIIAAAGPGQLVIPVQAVSETLFWLIKRARQPYAVACQSSRIWLSSYTLQNVDAEVMVGAMELVSMHHLQVFDAIILACAAQAGAEVLLSEDMQHGFVWRGVTVVNPFLAEPNPLVRKLIATSEATP